MKKLLKWIRKHVRPHFKYHNENGEVINFRKDDLKSIARKSEDKIETGIKFTFKF
jgi:hypothetical protein